MRRSGFDTRSVPRRSDHRLALHICRYNVEPRLSHDVRVVMSIARTSGDRHSAVSAQLDVWWALSQRCARILVDARNSDESRVEPFRVSDGLLVAESTSNERGDGLARRLSPADAERVTRRVCIDL